MAIVWRQVCGTGHRDLDPGRYGADLWDWVRSETRRVLVRCRDEFGAEGVISGMARGFDLELFELTDTVPGVAPHACCPYPQQPNTWPTRNDPHRWRERWHAAIARAASVHYVGDLDGLDPKTRQSAATTLLFDRNDTMLQHADAVIALYDPARNHNSGTHDAVEKARGRRRLREPAGGHRIGLPIVHLNPATRTVGIVQDHLPAERRIVTTDSRRAA